MAGMDMGMNKLSTGKQIMQMYFFASMVYFVSYITRVSYSTVLVEMASAEHISRSLLALPLTASFLTYGFGQIVSGWMGDKFDAFRLISIGLLLSALMNVLLPVFPEPRLMTLFWAANGFAQALIYPPLMKITDRYLTEQCYAKACLFITVGSHGATLLLYLAAPVMIAVSGWKAVFGFSFLCGLVFLVIWQFYAGSLRRSRGMISENGGSKEGREGSVRPAVPSVHGTNGESRGVPSVSGEKTPVCVVLLSSGLALIMAAVVMQGVLREGITAWMPAYLSDVFSLRNENAILTTVILPVFSIFSASAVLAVRRRFCSNELRLAAVLFTIALAAITALLWLRGSIALSVLLLAITSGCSHGVNFVLICLVPVKFEKYGRFSLVTGLINSCTYVGAAVSIYGFGAVSENCGWDMTLVLWGAAALSGLLCCIGAMGRWKRF